MMAKANKKALLEPKLTEDGKQQTTSHWFARYLRRPYSRQTKEDGSMSSPEVNPQIAELLRPHTAPSTEVLRQNTGSASMMDWSSTRLPKEPPPRPPRPDSVVIQHVNEWLDASMIKPATQLMGGLPYWREGDLTEPTRSNHVQYAIPIIQTPDGYRPTTSHSETIKSFCRRAKKTNVRMPSLLRARSHQPTVSQRKEAKQHSTSMPLLTEPSGIDPIPSRRFLIRSRSLANMVHRPNAISESNPSRRGPMQGGKGPFLELPLRRDSPLNARLGERESGMERRGSGIAGQSTRVRDHTRPSTAMIRIPREDSMGNLSDAPTYFSGPPPPSYRSRAASVLTTSSFGCVDGMNTERRHISQQKAAQRSRGMKGTFRKLAQKAHFKK